MFQITLSPIRLTGGIHGRSSTKIKVTYDDRLLGRVFLGGTVRFQINTKKDEIDFHVFLEVHSGRILGKAMISVRDIINKENSHIWCVIRSNDQISVKHRLKVLISSHRSFGKKIARKPTFSKHQIQDAKEFGQTVLRNEAFVNPLKTVKSDNEKNTRVRRRLVDSKFRSALVAACERGNKRAVELLLKGFDDTDVNILQRISNNGEEKKTITPIEMCAKNGHVKIAKILIDAGSHVDREKLATIAAENGRCQFMMMMIMLPETAYYVGKIDTRKLLEVCARNGHTKSLKTLMNSVGGRQILKNYGERLKMILSSESTQRFQQSRPKTVSRLYQRRNPPVPSHRRDDDVPTKRKRLVKKVACRETAIDSKISAEEDNGTREAKIAASVAWAAYDEVQDTVINVSKYIQSESNSAFRRLLDRARKKRRPVTAPAAALSKRSTFSDDVSVLWTIPRPDHDFKIPRISNELPQQSSCSMLDYLYGPLVSKEKKKKKKAETKQKKQKKKISGGGSNNVRRRKKKVAKMKRETVQRIVKGHVIRPSPV